MIRIMGNWVGAEDARIVFQWSSPIISVTLHLMKKSQ